MLTIVCCLGLGFFKLKLEMCHIVPMILLDVYTGRGGYLSHYSDIFHICINLLHSAGVVGWLAGMSGDGERGGEEREVER